MNYRHFSIYLVTNVLILFILVILPLGGGAFTLTLRKMNNTTGYKGMLRDRCPQVVNYALKWQKAKERWINHTYDKFIKKGYSINLSKFEENFNIIAVPIISETGFGVNNLMKKIISLFKKD